MAVATGAGAQACSANPAAEGCYGLTPQDLHEAYALPTTTIASAKKQTIALVEAYEDPKIAADLGEYDDALDLPACTVQDKCLRVLNQEGEKKPLPPEEGAWALETSLDVEVAHAICQDCDIMVVEANSSSLADLEAAENAAAAAGATEISDSWSEVEPRADSAAFDHPGIVITAASGDGGYMNWEADEAERGLVNYPASSPHVVAVGGTHLTVDSNGAWQSESVWNGDGDGPRGRGASGSGCSEHFTAAPWQREVADWLEVGCGSRRAVADIAADADPFTGVAVRDTVPDPEDTKGLPPDWTTVGGTSLATPIIAATFALAGGAGAVEYPARSLYENALRAPASLHAIASGSNGECTKPLVEDLASCTLSEEGASCAGAAICEAGAGYSGPTGVGTPDGIGAFEPSTIPAKKEQRVVFTSTPPVPASVRGSYAVSAEATSSLAVSFTSETEAVCTVEGRTVTLVSAGTCTVQASQAGDGEYYVALPVTQSFAVSKRTQTVTFSSSAPSSAVVNGPPYTVSAEASSGLPVDLSTLTPSVCMLAGATVSFVGAGTCTIAATQAGDGEFAPAPEAQQDVAVSKRTQTVTFTSSAPSSAVVNGRPYTVSAEASSGLPVDLSTLTPSVCTLAGATVSFVGAGTCTIAATQAGDGEFAPAPEAQQDVEVGAAPASAMIPLTVPTPALGAVLPFISSAPTPPSDSGFTMLRGPAVNHRTGAITFKMSVASPGTFTWLLTFENGKFGVYEANDSGCKAGQLRLDGACHPATVVFARGRTAAAGAGSVTFTIHPSPAARWALARALARRRGLAVDATITFHSVLGGPPVSRSRSLVVRLWRKG